MTTSRKKLTDKTKLYRIMPLERFLEMLYEHKNTLISPSLWDDPFEILFDEELIEKINKRSKIPTNAPVYNLRYEDWYGQSWSCIKESDSLWRAYTSGKKQRCVKIETTVKKLIASTKDIHNGETFILKIIDYGDIEDGSFLENADNIFDIYKNIVDESMLLPCSFLFAKRRAFQYENEVRLIAHAPNNKKGRVYEYDTNVVEFIDNVELDPWTPKESVEAIKKAIQACVINEKITTKIKVSHSVLYDKSELIDKLLKSIYE